MDNKIDLLRVLHSWSLMARRGLDDESSEASMEDLHDAVMEYAAVIQGGTSCKVEAQERFVGRFTPTFEKMLEEDYGWQRIQFVPQDGTLFEARSRMDKVRRVHAKCKYDSVRQLLTHDGTNWELMESWTLSALTHFRVLDVPEPEVIATPNPMEEDFDIRLQPFVCAPRNGAVFEARRLNGVWTCTYDVGGKLLYVAETKRWKVVSPEVVASLTQFRFLSTYEIYDRTK